MEASTCHNTTLDPSLILHWFFVSAVISKIELFGTVSNSFHFLITATKNSILDVAGVLDSNLIFVLHSYILINLKPILGPVRKLGKFGNLWKLGIFFSEIFKPEFSILTIGQNRKLGNKKTRNNISKISEVSEFSICHFLFSFLFFFFFYRCFFQDLYFTFVTSSTLYKYSSFISLTKYDFMCLFWSIKYIHNRQYI